MKQFIATEQNKITTKQNGNKKNMKNKKHFQAPRESFAAIWAKYTCIYTLYILEDMIHDLCMMIVMVNSAM